MKEACTHKTADDFSVVVPQKGKLFSRTWRCSSCSKTGAWADGWVYYGNLECKRCWAADIERVLCPECAPKQMQPGEQNRAKDGGNARTGNARGSGGRPAAQESATGKTALRAGARKTAQPPGSSPISHEAVPTPAQHAGRGGAVSLEVLAEKVRSLEPPARLILAAAFLEERKPELALAVVRMVEQELAAVLLLQEGHRAG